MEVKAPGNYLNLPEYMNNHRQTEFSLDTEVSTAVSPFSQRLSNVHLRACPEYAGAMLVTCGMI